MSAMQRDQVAGAAALPMETVVLAQWWRRLAAWIVGVAPALLSIVTFDLIRLPDGLWLFRHRRRQTLHDKLVGGVLVNA